MNNLRTEKCVYPNGDDYTKVFAGDLYLGTYRPVKGGFLPSGCRKPLASEREAQFEVIQRYVSHHLKLAAKAAALYKEF